MPVGEDDDIPLPEERELAPEDSHRAEPELEIDTRPISQRAAAAPAVRPIPNRRIL